MSFDDYRPLMLRPDRRGRICPIERVRTVVSRFFFEDRIEPLTQSELDAAHAHTEHAVEGAEHSAIEDTKH